MGLPQVGAVKPAVEGKSYHIKPQTSNLKLQTANRDTLQVVQSWLTRQLLMPQSRTRYKRQTANCMRTLKLHTMNLMQVEQASLAAAERPDACALDR